MLKKMLNKEKGFTLIEIIIVLAIAGLILAIVFIAVSGTQRARRDGARRATAARIVAAGEEDAAGNNGAYKATCPANGSWNAQAGETCANATSPATATAAASAVGIFVWVAEHECAAGGAAVTPAAGKAAVLTKLESDAMYCIGT